MEATIKPSWRTRAVNAGLRRMKNQANRLDIEATRARFARTDRLVRVPRWIRLEDAVADGVPGQWIRVESSRPEKVILYLHGGAFCLGATKLHKRMAGKLCRLTGFSAFMPFYRLAPENPYPAGPEDCLTAYRWLLEQGIEAKNIVVAGDSAGGSLTLSTVGRVRNAGLPLPSCAVMLSAGTDMSPAGVPDKSVSDKDPMLPREALLRMRDAYLADADPHDPAVSPVYLDYKGLPPLLFHVGSTEVLLDHTLRAAERAREAGVETNVKVWAEAPHVFQALGLLPESKAALKEIAGFIAEHAG